MRGGSTANASTGTHLPESPSPCRFQLDEVSSHIWHSNDNLVPPVRQGPLADLGGMAVPPEAYIFPDSHYPEHSLPHLGRSGAWTEPLTLPATHTRPLPTRSGWAALLLLCSFLLGPWQTWLGYCSPSLHSKELASSLQLQQDQLYWVRPGTTQ